MHAPVILAKASFEVLFKALQNLGTVYAPVRVSEQSFSFRKVESPQEIAFEALRTILPPKKFFYPGQETLVTYDEEGMHECKVKPEYQVIFGVHPCDLAGLGIMDTIFESGPADAHYTTKRQSSMIVGLSCMPDKHCFCQSMGTDCPTSGYDLFLTDIGESFFIECRTSKALPVLETIREHIRASQPEDKSKYKQFWNDRADAFSNGFAPNNIRSIMNMEWNNPIWDELGSRCLSCGNCTPVCPTCYCFDIVDIASLNGTSGERQRQWDSCQFTSFATVAGDFNFRATPVERLKFWYRHKLHGFEDAYTLPTCVGCGRCTVSCPAGIDDIVAVAKALQEQRETAVDHS